VSNIDASFNDASGHPSAFIQTKQHEPCVPATINEEPPTLDSPPCPSSRQAGLRAAVMVIGGQLVQGIWLLLNLGSAFVGRRPGLNVSVYQEDAKGYGAPVLWVPPAP